MLTTSKMINISGYSRVNESDRKEFEDEVRKLAN